MDWGQEWLVNIVSSLNLMSPFFSSSSFFSFFFLFFSFFLFFFFFTISTVVHLSGCPRDSKLSATRC